MGEVNDQYYEPSTVQPYTYDSEPKNHEKYHFLSSTNDEFTCICKNFHETFPTVKNDCSMRALFIIVPQKLQKF